MKYTILKPIYLSGKKRFIGDIIDESLIDKTRVWALKRSGFIAELGRFEGETSSTETCKEIQSIQTLTIPIHVDNNIQNLLMKPEDISLALSIMQVDTKKAIEQINHLDSEEVLILINAVDNRKSIKEAAAVAAKKFNQGEMESSEE